MTGVRNRDLFKLWMVKGRDNVQTPVVTLIWAHRMSDAVAVAEELVAAAPRRFLAWVDGIENIPKPDTDTDCYAQVIWSGGAPPAWPEST